MRQSLSSGLADIVEAASGRQPGEAGKVGSNTDASRSAAGEKHMTRLSPRPQRSIASNILLQPWLSLDSGLNQPFWHDLCQRAVSAVIHQPGASLTVTMHAGC